MTTHISNLNRQSLLPRYCCCYPRMIEFTLYLFNNVGTPTKAYLQESLRVSREMQAKKKQYRLAVLNCLPKLRLLDGEVVTAEASQSLEITAVRLCCDCRISTLCGYRKSRNRKCRVQLATCWTVDWTEEKVMQFVCIYFVNRSDWPL